MLIKTSSTEGLTHLSLKKEVIQMLRKRKDVVGIKTEHAMPKIRGNYFNHVDVYAKKDDGSNIFIEVKTKSTVGEALNQLISIGSKNVKDEHIVICNFGRFDFFKRVWWDNMLEYQDFINKTMIYNYDKNFKLKHREVHYKNGEELWIDGVRVI